MTTILDMMKKDTGYLVDELTIITNSTRAGIIKELKELQERGLVEAVPLGNYWFYYKK
jgi:predicted transcriptional regulator